MWPEAQSFQRIAAKTRLRLNADIGLHIARNEMSQERNPCLQVHRNCHGAKSVIGYRHDAVVTSASWFASGLAAASKAISLSAAVERLPSARGFAHRPQNSGIFGAVAHHGSLFIVALLFARLVQRRLPL